MRAQLLVASVLASGLLLLNAVACGTDTVYVYEDAGPGASTSSGKSSSGHTSTSSGNADDDDSTGDDDDDTTSSSSSSGSTSSGGFPVMPSTKLADGDNVVLLGIVGDDALYRTIPASETENAKVFAIPLAGGTATQLFEIGDSDSLSMSGPVVAHWTGIANGAGNLEVWTRASGLKTGIATGSIAGLIRGSADGSRIAFGQDATFSGNKPSSTAIGIRGIGDTTNIVTLSGAEGQVNLAAAASCPPQLTFAGQTFVAEYCNGTGAAETRARLVALPAGATTLTRIDAANLADSNRLVGNVRFSVDANGAKVVASELGGTTNAGKVYTIASPGTGVVTLEALPSAAAGSIWTMTADGSTVLYRTPTNDLKAATVTAAPATTKVVSAGVLTVTNLSLDGHSVMFSKLARDPQTNLIDVNIADLTAATPAPKALIAEAKGLPLGFTGTSAQAIYLDGTGSLPKLKSIAVAGGAPKDLVPSGGPPVGGRAATSGTGFVFFTNVKNGSGSTPVTADINYVDAVAGGQAKKIGGGVPLAQNDTEFFVSGKKVAFTSLTAGEEGIYGLTLP